MSDESERTPERAARLALSLAAALRRIAELERRIAELEAEKNR